MAKIWTVVCYPGDLEIERPDGTQAFLKPGETVPMGMGTLEFGGEYATGYFVIRRTASGKISKGYPQALAEDVAYRVGPFRAHRIVNPEDESDPILRVMRGQGIPVGHFRPIEGSGPVVTSYCDYDESGFTARQQRTFTDAKAQEVMPRIASDRVGEVRERLSGATVAVEAWAYYDLLHDDPYSGMPNDYNWYGDITRVFVAPGASPELVREKIIEAKKWVNEFLKPRSIFSFLDLSSNEPVEVSSEELEELTPEQIEAENHELFMDAQAAEMAELDAFVREAELLDCDSCIPSPACTSCPTRLLT